MSTGQNYGANCSQPNPFEPTAQSIPQPLTAEQSRQIGLTLLTSGLITDEQFHWGRAFRILDGGMNPQLPAGSVVYTEQLDPTGFRRATGKIMVVVAVDGEPDDYYIGRVKRIGPDRIELTQDERPLASAASIPYDVRRRELFLVSHRVGAPVL